MKKEIIEKVNNYVEKNERGLRSAISLIPCVGGALDHLVFDRYDEIRMENIEIAIKSISEMINSLSNENIVKEWFESKEALNTFKTLIEAIQCEHEEGKIHELSSIYPLFGTKEFLKDTLKVSIIMHLGQMTEVSIKLLKLISKIDPASKYFSNDTLEVTKTAIWNDQILESLKNNPEGMFWKGKLQLTVEMQILESKNVIQKVESSVSSEYGYKITALGKKATDYLNYI